MSEGSRDNDDFDMLRSSIVTRFRDQLRTAVDGALRAADDVLFDWAYTQSLKSKTTQDCIDLMRMLRLRRESFVETFMEHFDRGSAPPDDAAASGGELELALKADDQQELEFAVQNFISTVTNHSEALHGDLMLRLAALETGAGDDEVSDRRGLRWRISTEHVAQTFREAAATLELDAGMQVILFKLFERCATPALSAGYALIERDLAAAGVAAPQPGTTAGPAPGDATTTDGGFAGMASDAAAQSGQQVTSATYGMDAGQVSHHFAQQLMGAPVPGGGAGGIPAGTYSWSGQGGGQGAGRGSGGMSGAYFQSAQQFADLHTQRLDQMLGGYAAMAPSPERARDILQPLIMPLMRLSAAQPELLSDSGHRIRSLLDQAVAEGASPTRDAQTTRILEELQDVIGRLAESVQLPRDFSRQQRRLPDEEQVASSLAESRRARSQRAVERARRFAGAEVDALLDQRTLVEGGNAWLRTVMVPYLAWAWISKGERSRTVREARDMLSALADGIDPASAVDARDAFESLVERSARTLHAAGARLPALNRIMVRYRQLHAAACEAAVSLDELLGDQRFQDREAPPPESSAEAGHETEAPAADTAAPRPPDITETAEGGARTALPESTDSWLSAQLRVGDWWRIGIDADARPLFARVESSAHPGQDVHFSAIDNDGGIERFAWHELRDSVLSGRSRPLHPPPGFSAYIRAQAA